MPLQALLHFLVLVAFATPSPRLVTVSPALTELAFQLGLGNQIVGVSDFSDSPEAAKALPRIGALFHPSVERTLQLKPDWVLLDSFTLNPSYVQALEALRVPSTTFKIESVEALFKSSREILGEKNLEVLKEYESRWEKLKQKARPFKFVYLTWSDPAIAASRATFFSNLFEKMGGENLVPAGILAPYVPLSREWMLQKSPDFVFVLENMGTNVPKVTSYFPPGNTRVIRLADKYYSKTNFSGILGLEQTVKELWP